MVYLGNVNTPPEPSEKVKTGLRGAIKTIVSGLSDTAETVIHGVGAVMNPKQAIAEAQLRDELKKNLHLATTWYRQQAGQGAFGQTAEGMYIMRGGEVVAGSASGTVDKSVGNPLNDFVSDYITVTGERWNEQPEGVSDDGQKFVDVNAMPVAIYYTESTINEALAEKWGVWLVNSRGVFKNPHNSDLRNADALWGDAETPSVWVRTQEFKPMRESDRYEVFNPARATAIFIIKQLLAIGADAGATFAHADIYTWADNQATILELAMKATESVMPETEGGATDEGVYMAVFAGSGPGTEIKCTRRITCGGWSLAAVSFSSAADEINEALNEPFKDRKRSGDKVQTKPTVTDVSKLVAVRYYIDILTWLAEKYPDAGYKESCSGKEISKSEMTMVGTAINGQSPAVACQQEIAEHRRRVRGRYFTGDKFPDADATALTWFLADDPTDSEVKDFLKLSPDKQGAEREQTIRKGLAAWVKEKYPDEGYKASCGGQRLTDDENVLTDQLMGEKTPLDEVKRRITVNRRGVRYEHFERKFRESLGESYASISDYAEKVLNELIFADRPDGELDRWLKGPAPVVARMQVSVGDDYPEDPRLDDADLSFIAAKCGVFAGSADLAGKVTSEFAKYRGEKRLKQLESKFWSPGLGSKFDNTNWVAADEAAHAKHVAGELVKRHVLDDEAKTEIIPLAWIAAMLINLQGRIMPDKKMTSEQRERISSTVHGDPGPYQGVPKEGEVRAAVDKLFPELTKKSG